MGGWKRWWVVWLALASVARAEISVPEGFRVFDAINWRGKPSLAQFGLERLRIVYEGELWPPGVPHNQPVEPFVRTLFRKLDPPPGHIVCVDVEHWPLRAVDDNQIAASIDKYVQLATWIKSERPELKLGFYGIPPVREYWAAQSTTSPESQRWRTTNDKLRLLADKVDVVFPSLYTFYPNREGWTVYAEANLAEARKYGKPVYVFLMPVYHPSHRRLQGQPIPAEFWRQQLETVARRADGLVIWTGPGKHWRKKAPWWRTTKQFLQSLRHAPAPAKPLLPPRLRTTRAGLPATTAYASTSWLTTAQAPTKAAFPTLTPGRMKARAPTKASAPITIAPVNSGNAGSLKSWLPPHR